MAAVPNLLGRTDYTRDEVTRLEEAGILTDRCELIDGELVSKMGQNPPHARSLQRIYAWLIRVFGVERVRNQAPIEVAEKDRRRNDPLPDIVVVAEDKPEYDERHPRGDELVLLVEVSDTSSRYDRTKKLSLYARAGVPEYWVLDVPKRRLTVYSELEGESYRRCQEVAEHDTVSLADFQSVVSDILPRSKPQ